MPLLGVAYILSSNYVTKEPSDEQYARYPKATKTSTFLIK